MDELRALVAALPPELARRAFTHTSWTEDRAESYERLEFLGDGVLGLAVAEELCRLFPDVEEGRLAKLRAHVVSRRSCAVGVPSLALALELGSEVEHARHDRTRAA